MCFWAEKNFRNCTSFGAKQVLCWNRTFSASRASLISRSKSCQQSCASRPRASAWLNWPHCRLHRHQYAWLHLNELPSAHPTGLRRSHALPSLFEPAHRGAFSTVAIKPHAVSPIGRNPHHLFLFSHSLVEGYQSNSFPFPNWVQMLVCFFAHLFQSFLHAKWCDTAGLSLKGSECNVRRLVRVLRTTEQRNSLPWTEWRGTAEIS